MIALLLGFATALTVSQAAFEAQSKVCGIDTSYQFREPHRIARLTDDGGVIVIEDFAGMDGQVACLKAWSRDRGVTFIRMRP